MGPAGEAELRMKTPDHEFQEAETSWEQWDEQEHHHQHHQHPPPHPPAPASPTLQVTRAPFVFQMRNSC